MSEEAPQRRTESAVDQIADQYVETITSLSPMAATALGLAGDETALDDLSPAGLETTADAARTTLAQLAGTRCQDATDEVTVAAMKERLGIELELHEAGERLGDLNVIASPLQTVREVFDLMPTDSADDWQKIGARMHAVPGAIDGYIESLQLGAKNGKIAARRQFDLGISEAEGLAAKDSSFWYQLAQRAKSESTGLPAPTQNELASGAEAAASAYGKLAGALRDLAGEAPAEDAVGRERYERFSRYFLGAKVDLDETYEWGLGEVARIRAEQEAVAAQIAGKGATVAEAMAALDGDPARQLHGTDGLRTWMQATADEAIKALNGTHFDIPAPVQTVECMIAPTQSGGIYYTGPSEDFSRPGRMWWAVPAGVDTFTTWREKTTVYHEGVPGHHLQLGQTAFRSESLNLWRRMACWVSGHGEGWALYAEKLMADLGYMQDPGDYMGMLDSQALRATRVIVDIGVHLKKQCPQEWGGGTWDNDKAWQVLNKFVSMEEKFLKFELNRYLGWPGQAPSYKVGQRLWEQLRDQAKQREGADFDLKAFHRRALDIGSVGLDTLAGALQG